MVSKLFKDMPNDLAQAREYMKTVQGYDGKTDSIIHNTEKTIEHNQETIISSDTAQDRAKELGILDDIQLNPKMSDRALANHLLDSVTDLDTKIGEKELTQLIHEVRNPSKPKNENALQVKDSHDETFDKTKDIGLKTRENNKHGFTTMNDVRLQGNKDYIDKFISGLKDKQSQGKEIEFPEHGLAKDLAGKAPKTYNYLNQQLKEHFNYDNASTNDKTEAPAKVTRTVIGEEKQPITIEADKQRSTVETKGKDTGIKAKNPMKPREVSGLEESAEQPVKLNDYLQTLKEAEPDNVTKADKTYFDSMTEALLNYNPDIKVHITNESGLSTYNSQTNTITVRKGKTESISQAIAKQMLVANMADITSALEQGKQVNKNPEKVVQLNKEISHIRNTLNQILTNPKSKIQVSEKVKATLLAAMESNTKLLTESLTNPVLIHLLKSIEVQQSKRTTNIFKRIANAVAQFLGLPTNTLFAQTIEAVSKAVQLQNDIKGISYEKSENALLHALRGITSEQVKAELAKPFEERNQLIANFVQKQDMGKPFTSIPLLASKLKLDLTQIVEKLHSTLPTKVQREQITDFLHFNNEFNTHLLSTFKAKDKSKREGNENKDYRYQDMKGFLQDENGHFDENTLTTIAHTVYQWLADNGTKKYNSYDEIKKLLNMDENATLPTRIANEYINMGNVQAFVAHDIGAEVVRSLGLNTHENANPDMQSRLAMSIGSWAINAMQSADLIHIHKMDSAKHLDNIQAVGGKLDNKVVANEDGKISFISMTDINGENLNPRNEQIKDFNNGTQGYLGELLGSEIGLRYPKLTVPEKVKLKIKRTKAVMSETQEQLVAKIQQAPIAINKDVYNALKTLYKQDSEFVHELLGTKVSEDTLRFTHNEDKKSVISTAEGRMRELIHAFEWGDSLNKDANGEYAQFYDSIYAAKNNRMHNNSNVFNFQSSKIHRALGELANFKNTFETEAFNKDSTSSVNFIDDRGNITEIGNFLKAIAENAEGTENAVKAILQRNPENTYKDGTVDKVAGQEFLPALYEHLTTDKDVLKAVEATKKLLNNPSELTSEDKQAIATVVKQWDMGVSSFRALVEYTKFTQAIEEGKPFTTSFGLSSDGVNNGNAIGYTGLGAATKDFMRKVGLLDNEFNNYYETKKAQVLDYYSALGIPLNEALDKIRDSPTIASILALNPSLQKRSALKAILIPFGYGAGMSRIRQAVFEQFLSDVREQMTDIAKTAIQLNEKAQNNKITQDEYNQQLSANNAKFETLNQHLKTLLDTENVLSEPKELLNFWFNSKQEKALFEAYDNRLGQIIERSLTIYAGDFIDKRNQNIAYHTAAYEGFVQVKNELTYQAIENKKQILSEQIKKANPEITDEALQKETDKQFILEGLTQKEINKQILTPLKEVTPKINSAFNYDEISSRDSDIQLYKEIQELNNDDTIQAAGYQVNEQGNLVPTLTRLPVSKDAVASVGVMAGSAQVQSTDAKVSALATALGGKVNINVHDANISGIKNFVDMVKMQNKAFFQTVTEYHMQAASIEAVVKVVEGFKHLNKLPDTFKLEIVNNLISLVAKSPALVEKYYEIFKLPVENIHWAREVIDDIPAVNLNDKNLKMFNPKFAILKDGRSIMEAFHLDIKGFRERTNDWFSIRKEETLNGQDRNELYQKYKNLWIQYLKENPEYYSYIKEAVNSEKVLVDMYAATQTNTPKVLAEIILRNEVEHILTYNDIMQDMVKPFLNHVITDALNTDRAKLESLKSVETVHQYAGENGEYRVTATDKKLIDKQYEVLDKKQQELLDRVNTALSNKNQSEVITGSDGRRYVSLTPKEQAKEILQGSPVSVLEESKLNMPKTGGFSAITKWATDLFNSYGNKAVSPILGEVALTERSVKDSLGHGKLNPYKNMAFASVKEVIEKGTVIAKDINDLKEESYFISAPVEINGKENIVTVIVHKDSNTQRMYVHSLMLKEGLLKPRVSEALENTSRTQNGSLTSTENLLTPRVSEAQEQNSRKQNSSLTLVENQSGSQTYGKENRVSKNHDGSITPTDIHNILHELITDKSKEQLMTPKGSAVPVENHEGNLVSQQKASLTATDTIAQSNPHGYMKNLVANIIDESPEGQHQKALLDYLSDQLKATNPDIKIEWVEQATLDNEKAYGAYNPQTNTIELVKSKFDSKSNVEKASIILHEMVHAATELQINNPNLETKLALDNLNKMKDYLNQRVQDLGQTSDLLTEAFSSVSEMIAYGLTHPQVRDFITKNLDLKKAGISYTVEKSSMLKAFLSTVAKFMGWKTNNKEKTNFNTLASLVEQITKQIPNPNNGLDANRVNATHTATIQTNQKTAVEVIQSLNKNNVSDSFNQHLDKLIGDTLTNFYDADTKNKQVVDHAIKYDLPSNTGFRTSEKEAHMYAAMFHVLDAYFRDHSSQRAKSEMSKLYEAVSKNYKSVKDLYPDFNNMTKTEQKLAKRQYDFLFKSDSKNAQEFLPRFAAIILTNEQANRLFDVNYERQLRQIERPIFDRAMRILEGAINWLTNKALKNDGKTVLENVLNLTQKLQQIDTQARNLHANRLEQLLNAMTPYTAKMDSVAIEGLQKLVRGLDPKQLNSKTLNDAHTILRNGLLKDHAEITQSLTEVFSKETGNKPIGEFLSITNEIGADRPIKQVLDRLSRMQVNSNEIRERVNGETQKLLNDRFKNDKNEVTLSIPEQEAITKVAIRSDIASLLDSHSITQVVSLLTNETKRQNVIKDLEKNTASHQHGNDMVKQTKNLGLYMAKEYAVAHTVKNADAIAIGLESHYQIEHSAMDIVLRDKLDKLASLYAVEYAKSEDKAMFNELVQEYPQAIKDTLELHKHITEKSKEDFIKNPLSYTKGYTSSRLNQDKGVMFINPITEKEAYTKALKEGWEEVSELKKDRLDQTNDKKVMLIHKNLNKQHYVNGVLDMSDTSNKGTMVYNTQHYMDLNRVYNERVAQRKANEHIPYDSYNPLHLEPALVASYNHEGKPISYSYEMQGAIKDAYLDRDNTFQTVLGIMHGNVVSKPAIEISQVNVANALYEDYRDNYHKSPKEFLLLSADSKDPKIQQMYRMMPQAFKEEATSLFGKGRPIIVRKTAANSVFGFRAYSMRQMFDKTPQEKNFIEKILTSALTAVFGDMAKTRVVQFELINQSIAKYAKVGLVVKSGAVMVNNIMSNMYMLMMKGVNPIQMIKDIDEAYRMGKQYNDASTRLTAISMELAINRNKPEKLKALRNEQKILVERMQNNKLARYMEAGMMSTIVEDTVVLKNKKTFTSEFTQKVDKYTKGVPKPLKAAFNWYTMHEGTVLFEALAQATQFSDFAAKYSLAEHNMKKGMGFEDAIQESQKVFINFNLPTSQGMDYMNRMAWFNFTKFFFRFQRNLGQLMKEKPATAIMQHMIVASMGGQGLFDPLMYGKLGNPVINYGGGFSLLIDAEHNMVTNKLIDGMLGLLP